MEVIIFLVIGVVFGFICSSIAGGKNRNAMLWGVLGFFFGLITLIIIAVLPRVESSGGEASGEMRAWRASQRSPVRSCPNCRAENSTANQYCANCGSELAMETPGNLPVPGTASPTQHTEPVVSSSREVACKGCGQEVDRQAIQCPNCGTPVGYN